MKILVMSDSHGYENAIVNAIHDNPEAEKIVFLGDGERDFEYALAECGIHEFDPACHKEVFQVCGNCDRFSREPVTIAAEINGVRILITHGFDQNVKYGYERLAQEAKQKNCKAAFFGHTHVKHCSTIGDVVVFNPGSIRSGSYGVITIENENISYEWKYV